MRFTEVDVFAGSPLGGNPLAVVHDADDLPEETMAAFARWTNLSETTFLLRPTTPAADYRVRIFTTGGELPFAGHPTLGSAHAWLEAGGVPASGDVVVQECGAGLVTVRRGERLAFEAPPLVRSGAATAEDRDRAAAALAIPPGAVRGAAWVDNGPGWLGLLLDTPESVLAARPDPVLFAGLKVGLVAAYPPEAARERGVDVEVRAFYADDRDLMEDPVTGSLNAGLGQWLIGAGVLPDRYVAAQGTALRRSGRVHVTSDHGRVWVAGDTTTRIAGTVDLRAPGAGHAAVPDSGRPTR